MLSVYKQLLSSYWRIFSANLRHSVRMDLAYFGNNWGNVISTAIYTVSRLIFVGAIFYNIRSFGGYDRNSMLLFMVVTQINFYIVFLFIGLNNVWDLVSDINTGNLDMILLKPLPHLFYLTTRTVGIVPAIRDGLFNVLLMSFFVHWTSLGITLAAFWPTVVVWVSGIFVSCTIALLLGLSAFWQGQATEIVSLSYTVMDTDMPLEAHPQPYRNFLLTGLPVLIMSALTASVLLGRSPGWPSAIFALSVAAAMAAIRHYLWGYALRQYTSASS